MWEMFSHPAFQAAISVAVLLAVVFVAFQVAKRLRDATLTGDMNMLDLSQDFEQMRAEGDLDEAELRRIKAVIGKNTAQNYQANNISDDS